MKYTEKTTLACKGPISQLEPLEVRDGPLLVGEKIIHRWENNRQAIGYNLSAIRPAFYKKEKAWLRTDIWRSIGSYCCDRLKDEEILTFRKGVDLLLEQGAFEHLFAR